MKKDKASDRSRLRRTSCRVLSGCVFLAAMAFTVHAQQLTFTTFAGPAGGAGSADGTGSAARFNEPSALAIDSSGNLYVTERANKTIRKITPKGVVTTLAGSAGLSGSADGTGSDARFDSPQGVAADSRGDVYVTDPFNGIRKITPAGVVTTLDAAAGLRNPIGVAIDSGGNLYVVAGNDTTVRKISPAGEVTTLAGTRGVQGSADGTGSEARFSEPADVATDSGGNVYVADPWNHTIRKITPAGVVTTVTDGSGDPRLGNPTSVATDASGNVYVTDTVGNTIRKITPAGVMTVLAGTLGVEGSADGRGSAASFSSPYGSATDRAGNVYVADTDNHTIRKITPEGVVTTLAGLAGGRGSEDGTGGAARFNTPSGVATDKRGNVYVADSDNFTIRIITPAGVVTTLAGVAHQMGAEDGTGSAARFYRPGGVAVDGDGNVYVADSGNLTIRKITASGVVTTLAGEAGESGSADGTSSAARFRHPVGVTADSAGNVYVADDRNETIRKITPAGVVETLAGLVGEKGSADGTGSAARFDLPWAVAMATGGGGNVYVTDENNRIRKITPAGVVTTLADAGGPDAADGTIAARPRAAANPGESVYLADARNRTIRKITPAGVVTILAGSAGLMGSADGTGSAAGFNRPVGVATDSGGNVYVADEGNHAIRIGRPALADAATIDAATGPVGTARQLNTSAQTATTWQWTLIRQPAASTARLSSASIRNPRFTPDVADLYIFQLTASNGKKTSITTVNLAATEADTVKP